MPAFFNTRTHMAYECLTNLIGITRSDDEDVADALENEELGDDWYRTTTSGLYLDELEGMISIKAVDQSQDTAEILATFFTTGRDNAIKMLAEDIMVGLTKRAINAQKKYTGVIASKTSNGLADVTGAGYAGMRLYTNPLKGGVITINTVYTMMNADATFDIGVYKVERGSTVAELVTTIPAVESQANTLKANTLTTPVVINLSQYGADYYLLYQPDGFTPRQNGISCGCGYKENILRSYMQVSGVAGNDVSTPQNFSSRNYAMGLALEVEAGCDTKRIICEAYNNDEAVKIVMAYAARYKAGELTLEYVLRSDEINRYTMSQREALYGKRNHFKAEYNDRITWLVENIDTSLIDCYVCNDKRVQRRGIVV
jgi:hypothetical protein